MAQPDKRHPDLALGANADPIRLFKMFEVALAQRDRYRRAHAKLETELAKAREITDAARWAVEASDLAHENYDVGEPAATDFREAADEAWRRLREALSGGDD